MGLVSEILRQQLVLNHRTFYLDFLGITTKQIFGVADKLANKKSKISPRRSHQSWRISIPQLILNFPKD